MATTGFTQRINGFVYGFSDIAIDVNGTTFSDITEVSYDTTIEKGKLQGTSPNPSGYTVGTTESKGSISIGKNEAGKFMALLGTSFAKVSFTMTVTFGPTEDAPGTFVTQTDVLNGCMITSVGNSHSPGGTASMVKFDLIIQQVIYNSFYQAFDPNE